MAFRLNLRAPLDAEIRRVAREQIDKAVGALSAPDADRDEAVHDARKRLKKLRGLFELVEAGHPACARAQIARHRDIGRILSGTRDRTALIEALDGLAGRFAGDVETEAFAVVRTALELKRAAAVEAAGRTDGGIEGPRDEAIERLRGGAGDLDAFVFKAGRRRGRTIVLAGLKRNYRRARTDRNKAARSGHSEDFHDLRKRIKYLGMHLQLLSQAWPEALEPLRGAADDAAEALGRDHDYAVLRAEIAAEPESFGARADLDVVLALLDRHQSELRDQALGLTGRLLAELPAAFADRFDALLRLAADHAPDTAPPEPPEARRRRAAPNG